MPVSMVKSEALAQLPTSTTAAGERRRGWAQCWQPPSRCKPAWSICLSSVRADYHSSSAPSPAPCRPRPVAVRLQPPGGGGGPAAAARPHGGRQGGHGPARRDAPQGGRPGGHLLGEAMLAPGCAGGFALCKAPLPAGWQGWLTTSGLPLPAAARCVALTTDLCCCCGPALLQAVGALSGVAQGVAERALPAAGQAVGSAAGSGAPAGPAPHLHLFPLHLQPLPRLGDAPAPSTHSHLSACASPACCLPPCPPAAAGATAGAVEKALQAGALAANLGANATLAAAAIPVRVGAAVAQVGGAPGLGAPCFWRWQFSRDGGWIDAQAAPPLHRPVPAQLLCLVGPAPCPADVRRSLLLPGVLNHLCRPAGGARRPGGERGPAPWPLRRAPHSPVVLQPFQPPASLGRC